MFAIGRMARHKLTVLLYYQSWVLSAFPALSTRQGRQKQEMLKFHEATPEILAITPDLESANSRRHEFSQTWRCCPRIRHTFNSGRSSFHQNLRIELKVMIYFPQIKYKYVAAILFHVSPRCAIVLLYEREESPSLQAMCYSFWGEAPFQLLSPRQGCPKSANRLERALFPQMWCISDLKYPHSRATDFSCTSRFQNLNPHGLNS